MHLITEAVEIRNLCLLDLPNSTVSNPIKLNFEFKEKKYPGNRGFDILHDLELCL